MHALVPGLMRLRALLALILLSSTAALAQQTEAAAAAAAPVAPAAPLPDERWLALQALRPQVAAKGSSRQTPPSAEEQVQSRQARTARFLQIADEAKAFRKEFPDHPKAKEARALEIDGLMGAVNLGDDASEGRLDLAVGELREDRSMPPSFRAQVTGTYLFTRAVRKNKSPAERMAAIEQTSRDLIREFPDQPQGYESLLHVALGSDDEKYRTLLFALWQGPAPVAVKNRVRIRMDRHFLTGEKISTLFADAAEKKLLNALTPNRPTVIYAWEAGNEASLVTGEMLKEHASGKLNIIGLCLDRDVEAARRAAQQAKLPGTMHYDARGRGGLLATRLRIDEAPAIILVGADGHVLHTRAEQSFAEKFARLDR